MLHSIKAFTLVELIVVITIVGILSTVGFVSYSGYLTGARDSNRFSQLTKISDSLQTYAASKSLPLPDDYIEITASGATNVIAYQGYVGVDVLETIDYTNGGRDPKDDSFFTYYLTKDRKSLQLLTFMEDSSSVSLKNKNELYAADYSERFPKIYGKKLGLLISAEDVTFNTPAQEISTNLTLGSLDIFNTTQEYTALFEESSFTYSGYALGAVLSTKLGDKAPSDCPDGFIGVAGNIEFNTSGFCVSQYEMSYSDTLGDTPNTTGFSSSWNTVSYISGKQISSQSGKYPITDINQQQAIEACNNMGNGYHLITNNEWMTIARSIESNKDNWSSGNVGVGNLSNGVSNDLTLGCNAEGGNSDPRSFATKTGPGNVSCNPLRSHKLASGGGIIWDFSGNVWEHTNKSNVENGSGFNGGQTSIGGSSNALAWDSDGIYVQNDMKKFGSFQFLGRTSGGGSVFYAAGVPNNIISRGGKADLGANTGMYAISLVDTNTIGFSHTGFRCAK